MAENPTFAPCPRCGENTLRTDRPALNALSRADNETYVCSPCGTAEAMEDFLGGERQPWVLRERPTLLNRDNSDD